MVKRFLREKIRHALSKHKSNVLFGGIALTLLLMGASCAIWVKHLSQ